MRYLGRNFFFGCFILCAVTSATYYLWEFEGGSSKIANSNAMVKTEMVKTEMVTKVRTRTIDNTQSNKDYAILSNDTSNDSVYAVDIPEDDQKLLSDFDAGSFFPSKEINMKIASEKIVSSLDIDIARKELLETAISDKFSQDLELSSLLKKSLLDREASNSEKQDNMTDFELKSEVVRRQYVNKLNGILTSEEFDVYRKNERLLVKGFISKHVASVAQKIAEQEGQSKVVLVNSYEDDIDSILDRKLKVGMSLGLVQDSNGYYSRNSSQLYMLSLMTDVTSVVLN